ncbi:serine/threonine-protein kinase Nek2 [Nilaparvata lugens]|uniref:serine/threonine-protein kinase Nek2 n=1 Tax=Nilaparvata lugens TaxID=108931 RepID=UPI00193D29DE|nr:serine/threonine-protein kinase Nek2 [Nilaparvata lugens]
MEVSKDPNSNKLEDFEVLEVIGSGSFGTCYKVCNKYDKMIYVCKAIDYGKMDENQKELLVSEVNVLSGLKHPNIVQYYSRIIHKKTTTLYIIMEYCEGGDLASIVVSCKKNKKPIEEGFIWQVLYQTGRALQACHSHLKNVVVLHRDIKPANVFLDSAGNVKLGDFGLARILQKDESCAETVVGTPFYMSPEVLGGGKYNRKSDIWALGCLIYELCALSPPFVASSFKLLTSSIKNGRFDRIPSYYSDDLQKMISFMLSVDHEYRPTIEMVLHHPAVVVRVSQRSIAAAAAAAAKLPSKRCSQLRGESDEEINEFIKSMSIYDREPLSVSEKTFKEKWMVRLKVLREKESNLRAREESLSEKERSLLKKEKQVSLMERVAKEKIARAEVYLKQCKENRPASTLTSRQHRMKPIEEADTSLSADPGDTSLVPTSAKMDPFTVLKPTFHRSASERRPKHVHFNITNNQSQRNLATVKIPAGKPNPLQDKVPPTKRQESDSYMEQRAAWLEQKRNFYRSNEKENCAASVLPSSSNNDETMKRKQSKGLTSIFSRKSLLNLR